MEHQYYHLKARKTPEKIQVTKEDLAELSETATADVDNSVGEETMNEQGEVSLDEVSNQKIKKWT